MAETSKRVSAAIKECWAKLASLQFDEAAKAVPITGGHSDTRLYIPPEELKLPPLVELRMAKVEDYLAKAGAEATKYYFTANLKGRD